MEGNDPPEDPIDLRPKVWRVSCRFIRDVDIFNEWGNELDYEMDEIEEEGVGNDGITRKNRKGRKSDEGRNKKKVETLISEAVGATEKMLQYLPPPTEDPTNSTYNVVIINGPSQCEMKTEINIHAHKFEKSNNNNNNNNNRNSSNSNSSCSSNGHGNDILTKKRGISPSAEQEEQEENGENSENPLQTMKKRLCLDENQCSIDGEIITYPVWFNRDTISHVEIRYVPEILNCHLFSQDSSTSPCHVNQSVTQKYITCRNYIMDLYTQNPYLYLSATECRQKIAGDVSFIIKIHEFNHF